MPASGSATTGRHLRRRRSDADRDANGDARDPVAANEHAPQLPSSKKPRGNSDYPHGTNGAQPPSLARIQPQQQQQSQPSDHRPMVSDEEAERAGEEPLVVTGDDAFDQEMDSQPLEMMSDDLSMQPMVIHSTDEPDDQPSEAMDEQMTSPAPTPTATPTPTPHPHPRDQEVIDIASVSTTSSNASISPSASATATAAAAMPHGHDTSDVGNEVVHSTPAALVFYLQLPFITDKARVRTPSQHDVHGQAWRVVWFPHGRFLDDKYVCVGVEMVVPDALDSPSEDTTQVVTTAGEPEITVAKKTLETPRMVQVEVLLLRPRGRDQGYALAEKSSVVAFSSKNREFALDEFMPRIDIMNPKDPLVGPDGEVEAEVRLHFVDGDITDTDTWGSVPATVGHDDVFAADTKDDDDDSQPVHEIAMDMTTAGSSPLCSPGEEMAPVLTPTASSTADVEATALAATQELMMYDSRHETGMVGLKNQGATCYLNSLLQTLFHLRAFRSVVYATPSEREDTNDSVSLALQRVFYRLQSQPKAVSTKELTRSFGWSQIDSFMQHDVQELYRILCDRLEEKMKHTAVDNTIKNLFEGKVRSFVQCVNVDYQSYRDESFYDLQLDVKGCPDVYASFRKYVEIEMLQGDNQYEAEGHGKQDAKKGIQFLQFPPVLNLQLKRFEYDPMRDGMVKVHDRFEFPKTLVLDEFAPHKTASKPSTTAGPSSEPSSPSLVYHLHSVLVHSGDVHGGHYYVFIRPAKDIANSNDWFKFDDDQISRVNEHTAIDGNFGSVSSTSVSEAPTAGTGNLTPRFASMLSSDVAIESQGSMDFQPLDAEDEVGEDTNANGGLTPTVTTSTTNNVLLPLGRSFSSAYMLVYVRDGDNDIRSIQEAGNPVCEVGSATIGNVDDDFNAKANGNGTTRDHNENSSANGKDLAMDASMNSNVDVSMNGDDSMLSTDDVSLSVRKVATRDDVAIPESLIQRFHEEEKATARRKKAQQTEHLYMTLRIASDTSIAALKKVTKNIDFSSFGNNSACIRIRIKRSAPIRQLYSRIYTRTGVPVARQRLWRVITRENRTHRPDSPLTHDTLEYRVESLIDEDASPKAPVRLYLQIVGENSSGDSICQLNRSYWDAFTPPVDNRVTDNGEGADGPDGGGVSAEKTDNAGEARGDDTMALVAHTPADADSMDQVLPAPKIGPCEILLFIKYYDVNQKLGDRLEYMGNILFDARKTGADLSAQLREILAIPSAKNIVMFEEIQPISVQEIEADATLEASEIQHGDIICYQLTDAKKGADRRPIASSQRESYPDIPSYFQYLLDRVDVTFHHYGCPDEEPMVVSLLFTDTYDTIIDAVAKELGLFDEDKRLFVRLYQHSPLNGLPKKHPLRHAKYAGDNRTTLEEFLTEYSERTTLMYYEILAHPITEIEAKKHVAVYFSIYDDCFVDPNSPTNARRLEFLVLATARVCDLVVQIKAAFELEADTRLRISAVSHHGTLLHTIGLRDTSPLEEYWSSASSTASTATGYSATTEMSLFVEKIPEDELAALAHVEKENIVPRPWTVNGDMDDWGDYGDATGAEDDYDPATDVDRIFIMGVVHFNFQSGSTMWMHPHGVPLITYFRGSDTVRQVKERLRLRMNVSEEVFNRWNLAFVKEIKATTLEEVYDESSLDAIDEFPMSQLQVTCGSLFEKIDSIGLEHADPRPTVAPKYARRQEQGIRIRQS